MGPDPLENGFRLAAEAITPQAAAVAMKTQRSRVGRHSPVVEQRHPVEALRPTVQGASRIKPDDYIGSVGVC